MQTALQDFSKTRMTLYMCLRPAIGSGAMIVKYPAWSIEPTGP